MGIPAQWPADQVERRSVETLIPYARNARTHSDEQVAQIAASIQEWGWTIPVLVDETGAIIAGHGRVLAARRLGVAEVPVMTARGWSEAQKRAYVLADNQLALTAGWDNEMLGVELGGLQADGFDLSLLGFGVEDLSALMNVGATGHGPGGSLDPASAGRLAERFGIVPFSVLNAREGWWQDRKRAWLSLGIRSEVGRGENLLAMSDTMLEPDPAKRAALKGKARTFGQDLMRGEHVVGANRETCDLRGGLTFRSTTDPYRSPGEPVGPKDKTKAIGNTAWVRGKQEAGEVGPGLAGETAGAGTSIFDPVLCELAYRWWSPIGGTVLDPFAGGSVRGIVAAKVGREYIGIDLRAEQVEANRAQAETICPQGIVPTWVCGDSREMATLAPGVQADFIFSCPPYADLEVYSDDPADLSTLEYSEFRAAYGEIIAKACAKLKPDRFACFVVGDVRDPKGAYRNFVGDTVEAFRAAGLAYYNEAILVTAAGSLPLRAGKQFAATRKLGKTHQNVLVFLKGDARRATAACGEPEFGEVGDETEADADAAGLEAQFGVQL